MLELPSLGGLAQDGGVQTVGFVCVGEVHHLEVHGVGAGAVRVVPQLKFGFVGACYLDIGPGGHSKGGVGQACALTADEIEGVVLLVPDGGGSAHEQTVHHMGQLLLRHAGFPQVLPHQSSRGGHGGRGHGGTGSHGVVIAHISREHVAADAGDLRLQGQAVGGTPGGEAGYLTCKLAGIPNGVYSQESLVRKIGPNKVVLRLAGGSHGDLKSG